MRASIQKYNVCPLHLCPATIIMYRMFQPPVLFVFLDIIMIASVAGNITRAECSRTAALGNPAWHNIRMGKKQTPFGWEFVMRFQCSIRGEQIEREKKSETLPLHTSRMHVKTRATTTTIEANRTHQK